MKDILEMPIGIHQGISNSLKIRNSKHVEKQIWSLHTFELIFFDRSYSCSTNTVATPPPRTVFWSRVREQIFFI
jgi:hypothetical protein